MSKTDQNTSIKGLACIIVICTSFFTYQLNAELVPLRYFAENPKFTQIKISPDGTYLAVTAPLNNQTVLITMISDSMKPVDVLRFGKSYHINEYHWANNDRLVFKKHQQLGAFAAGKYYHQIYAANVDGKKFEAVFGHDVGAKRSTSGRYRWEQPARAWGEILTLLKSDAQHIIISAQWWSSDADEPKTIYKLNIYNGERERIGNTALGNSFVYVNENGFPELMSGYNRQGAYNLSRFINNSWQTVNNHNNLPTMIRFYRANTSDIVYTYAVRSNATAAIYRYNIVTANLDMAYQHETVDPEILLHPVSNEAFGVKTYSDKLNYHYFDRSTPWSYTHRTLRDAFPGQAVDIVSATDGGQKAIVLVSSDKNPGAYYLYDSKKSELRFLESKRPNINPDMMMPKLPIQFTSRDGAIIRGFMTKPSDNVNFPMVVLVHGGPFGIKDTWTYDSEVQLLANRGYGVLQVNYRGSGGYGQHYETAGSQKMGTLIQQDIVDGTRWAVEAYELDKNKVCIMGSSFGAYSALMAPIREQDVFSCSIAISGVYDWVKQDKEADYADIDSIQKSIKKHHGNDQLLRQQSPIHQLDKFNIPLLLVHGGKDQRTTPKQFKRLKKALKKQNADFETLYKKEEGHGFFDTDNREELYSRIISFLDKNIGS